MTFKRGRPPKVDTERILWMRTELGLFYSEIAKRVGISKHAVYRILHDCGVRHDKINHMLDPKDPGVLGQDKVISVGEHDLLLERLWRHHV